jgi:hypothetical protein
MRFRSGEKAQRLVTANNTLLPGVDGSLRPVSKVQFTQDVADVSFDSVLADHQFRGNW